jgi:hypothetical protein
MTRPPRETRKAKTTAKTSAAKKRAAKTRQAKRPTKTVKAKKSRSKKLAGKNVRTDKHPVELVLSDLPLLTTTEHIAEVTAVIAPPSPTIVHSIVVETATQLDVAGKLQSLDWSLRADGTPLNEGKDVAGDPDIYKVNGGSLLVTNESGVFFRFCSKQFDVNLPENSALLTALDPDAKPGGRTPIELTFQNPLSFVAAYVTVEGQAVQPGTPLHAIMWYQIAGTSAWQSVSGSGVAVDRYLPPEAAPTAPFVKVAGGTHKISKVRFDAALIHNQEFRQLVMSQLLWQP